MIDVIEIACLYYEVLNRFYETDIDTYLMACHELNVMAKQLGCTPVDIAKVLTYS